MKPQDTVIYLLGELKGQVTGLQGSVDKSSTAQATINADNETEHAKFRTSIASHDTAIAGFTQDRLEARSNKLSGMQLAGLWIAAIGGLSGIGTLIYFITHP